MLNRTLTPAVLCCSAAALRRHPAPGQRTGAVGQQTDADGVPVGGVQAARQDHVVEGRAEARQRAASGVVQGDSSAPLDPPPKVEPRTAANERKMGCILKQ
ncbi:Pup--protein ligase [Frankliniella fusca]|uniref:Pup--protein ligase n=1 Tax=Frankliniella fusca TaxID=407009 RepID=A0AAE1GT71_9NEOP|nr:Pup--protein ligase [Frankliniella fusca]